MNETEPDSHEPIDPFKLAEVFCWAMVVMTPILVWLNGPPVSREQFVVRIGVVVLALVGGVGLRVINLFRGRRNRDSSDK